MQAPKKLKHHQAVGAQSNMCNFHFVDGAFLEITGNKKENYLVQFGDNRTGEIIHQATIGNNCWVKTARQYFTPWNINVLRVEDQALVFTHTYACQQKRVYIALESKALGDTLAWIHSVEEFRQRHNCVVICSTFMNELFTTTYPAITFVLPGTTVHNLYAMYRLGWFYQSDGEVDYHRNVANFRLQPLGATATDILGLPYIEARPRLKSITRQAPLPQPYVCIAIHATAQAKYWNHPTGWDELVVAIKQRGYQVILLSKEGLTHMGNTAPKGVERIPEGPLETIIHYLQHATLFIGIGSGLSWLAWATGCKTCLISGFSYPYTEVEDVIRISPDTKQCSGCFNRYLLQADDWNWCPDHKNTPRMFECTKSISATQVIKAIDSSLPHGCVAKFDYVRYNSQI